MRRFITVLFVIAVIAGSWLLYSGRFRPAEAARPEGITTEPVTRGDIDATVSATGNLQPERSAPLTFALSGRVAEVLVQEGERVTTGQVLARLDTEQVELNLKQARAALAVAEATLTRSTVGAGADEIASAEAALAAAQAQLADLLRGPSDADRRLANLQVDQARNSLYAAQGSRDAIAGQPFASPGSIDSAEAQVLNAEVAVQIAELNRAKLDQPPSAAAVAQARAQVAQAQAALEALRTRPSAEDIAVAETQVAQARVGVEIAESQLRDAELVAPFDGYLTPWNIHVGDTVTPAQPVGTLVTLDALHLQVTIDETEIGRIAVGQRAMVSLDAFPDAPPLEGWVASIETVGQQAQGIVNYGVRVNIPPTSLAIRPQMTAAIDIVVEQKQDVLLVPNRALLRDARGRYVQVLRDNVLVRADVETGLAGDQFTEIVSGLSEGDEVVVTRPRQNILSTTGPFGG